MSKAKPKHTKAPIPSSKAKAKARSKKSDETELDNQSLDEVSGGFASLETAIPSFGAAALSSEQTPKCISQ